MSTLFSPKMERQRTGIHPVVLDWNQRNWCRLMVYGNLHSHRFCIQGFNNYRLKIFGKKFQKTPKSKT
jgi:hypothetical protein